ncbi:uncharacterized protein LOC106871943 [Octopus bimaculoides]|uniref:TPM domain-containing protein n=1 Tax=Octopus bimaculoides TaxID=37653 RepID=A0A0L8HB85_OCTBM|nr:uncharacterized protein LOC106871943 [Octopus bimaculoides]XP_052831355.1 uncharacterized protein LOC106871943 [Octopus bimaculoides]|eukprot:XP_014774202.1 PREDICTED: uncharacterized protein LOC106871943 [Octopus bimaculoides]
MSFATITLLFSLLVCTIQLSNTAEEKPSYWYPHDYPNPRKEQARCGRELTKPSWLCDPDKLLTEKEAMEVDKLIASVRTKTRCPCYKCVNKNKGYLIMVALMGKMYRNVRNKNDSEERLFQDSKKFATKLMRRWGGRSMCEEFVIILYSKADNVLYTVTEKNAGKILNETMVMKEQDYVKWYFGSEDVGNGLVMMIEDYRDMFLKKFKERPVEDFMKADAEPVVQEKSEAKSNAIQNNIRQSMSKLFLGIVLILLFSWN